MNIRSLFLASAALVSAGGAFAADLPAKQAAPAADAVRACPAYGSGFFTLPGSETCLAFSGYMRTRISDQLIGGTVDSLNAPYKADVTFRLNTDVRSNSEIGVIRGFARLTSTLSEIFPARVPYVQRRALSP